MTNRMLVLEFNELCPNLLERFMEAGQLPHFARLYSGAEIYTTTTDDAHLEPWVQWITFHCGVGESVHRVEELDQGHTVRHPAIWDVAAEFGLSSVVFGAMNTAAPRSAASTFLLPDPWSTRVPVPRDFLPYQKFVRGQVLGHTGKASMIRALPAFLAFMVSHGLSIQTVGHLLGQLVAERTTKRDLHWRRASCLDELQWDVFRHLWRKRTPDLAIFFSNSTAFLQHRYWRHMDPGSYDANPSRDSIEAYGNAILYGYQKMDQLVGDALRLAAHDGATLVLATALSQQPNLRYESIGGKFAYRPHEFRALLSFVGVPADTSVEPVMTHQAWLSCRDETQARQCERALLGLQMNGEPIMSASRVGSRIYFDCKLISQVPEESVMTARDRTVPFHRYFASLGQVVNARHHPDGALWIHSPHARHGVQTRKLNLAEVSKILLDRLAPKAVADDRHRIRHRPSALAQSEKTVSP